MKENENALIINYYTPSIEEFNVGFEFEMDAGTGWCNQIFPNPWWYDGSMGGFKTLKNCIEGETVRVKELNPLDFESIGFLTRIEKCPFYGTRNFYVFDGVKQSKQWMDGFDTTYFIEQEKHQLYKITKVDEGGFSGGITEEQMFYGVIKNKSELICILKQLKCKYDNS